MREENNGATAVPLMIVTIFFQFVSVFMFDRVSVAPLCLRILSRILSCFVVRRSIDFFPPRDRSGRSTLGLFFSAVLLPLCPII